MFVYILLTAFLTTRYKKFLPISQLEILEKKYIGLGLLAIGFILIIIAQGHMKNSWQIGIDIETKTEHITT